MRKLFSLLDRRGLVAFCSLALVFCFAAAAALYARHPPELLQSANKLGPAARSLVQGRGLAICYSKHDATRCLYGQRMPIAPLTLAALYRALPGRPFLAVLIKTFGFFLPVIAAFALAWRHAKSGKQRSALLGLCLVAVALPPTLDLAVNLNFEEAYFYGFLALAFALLLFPESQEGNVIAWAASLVFCAGAVYLTKSSMLLAAVFLVVMAARRIVKRPHGKVVAGVMVLVFSCIPVTWGMYQSHASGRFSVGSSLDGSNLYKGNNPHFLERYPAFRGASQDPYEAELFADHVSPADNWSENDYGLAAAKAYVQTSPKEAAHGMLRKVSVFFLGILPDDDGSHSHFLRIVFVGGLIACRLLLLFALAASLRSVVRNDAQHADSWVFLGMVTCIALPYLLGFALVRHAMPLTLPAALYLAHKAYSFQSDL